MAKENSNGRRGALLQTTVALVAWCSVCCGGDDLVMPINAASFLPGVEYPVEKGPMAVKIGDLTGSGGDLVVGSYDVGSVRVLKNVDGGKFEAVGDYLAEPRINSVAIGDMDGDGINDVVVGSLVVADPAELVAVLHNSGAANLRPPIRLNSSTGQGAVELADFNRDKQMDVAVTAGDGVDILLNQGVGTYAHGAHYRVGWGSSSLSATDLNRDGLLDLVVVAADVAKAFLGDLTDGFMPPLRLPVLPSAGNLALGDLNNDQILDAVLGVATTTSDGVVGGFDVLIGRGDGTFEPSSEHWTGRGETGIALADINHDSRLDIITICVWCDDVAVYLNTGRSGFAPPLRWQTGSMPTALSVGDLNGDGKPDLTVANYVSSTVSVFLNDSPGY